LGDIAEIHSTDAAMVERLRSISLGYAPNVGTVRELPKERIAMALAAAGFSVETVKLQAPAIAIIRRAGQRVAPALLREAVERVALADFQALGAKAELVRLDLPQALEVPSGRVEARASLGGVKDYFAPFPVSIELLVDGRVARRLSLTAQVEAQAPALVAAHNLAEHTRLRDGDVRVEMRKLERSASLYVRDPERLRGAALTRAVMSGEPITTDAIYAEIIIKPGDAVSIVGESGQLNVKVAGEARAAGRVGDRIQVKNLQSGVLLQATVVDEGLVRVRF
jgi:flagella basal body P-ring formation protein FlgA